MILDLLKNKEFQKYFTNVSWLMTENIIRGVIGVFVLGFIARYLGPEQYGKLSFAATFVLIPSILANLGLREIVVRDLVKEQEKTEEILATAFILKLLGGIFVLFISLGMIMLIRPTDIVTWWLAGIIAAGSIFMACEVTDFWFQSQVKSKYTAIARLVVSFIASLLKVWLVYLEAPLIAFAWVFLFEIFLQALSLLIAYQVYGKSIKVFRGTFERAKILLSNSWLVALGTFALLIQSYMDQIMLGQMVGDKEVGQYSAALKVIEFSILLPLVVCSSIAPAITHAKMRDKAIYHHYLLNNYRLMFLFFLLISIPIFFFAKPVIFIIYGNAYQHSAELLPLLTFRLFFANFFIARNLLFIVNEGLFSYSLLTTSMGAVTNIVLNYFLIPRYYSFGAIWASIISFSVTIFLIDIFYSKTKDNLRLVFLAIMTPFKLRI